MNKALIALVLTFASQAAFAQAAYNGVAKSQVTQFWRSIERADALPNNRSRPELLRLEWRQAQTHLQHSKQRDPALDTRTMEAALAKLQSQLQEQGKAVHDQADQKRSSIQYLSRFGHELIGARGESQDPDPMAVAEAKLVQFRQGFASFMSVLPDASTLMRYEAQVMAGANDALRLATVHEQCVKSAIELRAAHVCLAAMHLAAGYWDGTVKLYPQHARAAAVLKALNESIAALGPTSAIQAGIEANRTARVSNNRMLPAAMNDPELQQAISRLFERHNPGLQPFRVNITGKDWVLERNGASGAVTARNQSAAIAARQGDGKCLVFEISVMQLPGALGQGFGDLQRVAQSSRGEIRCDVL